MSFAHAGLFCRHGCAVLQRHQLGQPSCKCASSHSMLDAQLLHTMCQHSVKYPCSLNDAKSALTMSRHHVHACLIAKHNAFLLHVKHHMCIVCFTVFPCSTHKHKNVAALALPLLSCRLDLMCRKLQPSESQKKLLAEQPDVKLGRTSSSIPAPRPSIDAEGGPPDAVLCAAGTVRGEDYNFHFTGKIKDGKLYVRLNLEYEGDSSPRGVRRPLTLHTTLRGTLLRPLPRKLEMSSVSAPQTETSVQQL